MLQRALGANYTLQRELGGGGMSLVFVARDESLSRDVVVKILMPELAATLNVERFTREIKLVAKLQQANIVPVLTAGAAGALPFYSMPFIEGLSLRQRMQQGPQPGLGESVRILGDIARALEYAHEHGVVHRDIKPENVLLSGGTAVVTDFGIAKAINAALTQPRGKTLTGSGSSVGTPGYMSPEQAAGDHVDERTDLYAWGVVAYELISGVHPFPGKKTAQQLIAAQIAEKPQPIDECCDVPAPLAALIMRSMEKEPSERPQSAREVIKALDDSASLRPPLAKWKLGALVVVVVLLLAAAIILRGPIANWIRRVSSAGDDAPVISTLAVLPFANNGGSPIFTPLRSDPRFQKIIEKMGLAEYPGLLCSGRERIRATEQGSLKVYGDSRVKGDDNPEDAHVESAGVATP